MSEFRKIPVIIQAVRLKDPLYIDTLEGRMLGGIGDWIVTGIKGERYPVKHDIFIITYEPVGNDKCNYCMFDCCDDELCRGFRWRE